jgi:ferrous iron transport protein B
MATEIIIAVGIIAAAGFILFKDLKKSTSGKCNCGSCSSSCPKYKNISKK